MNLQDHWEKAVKRTEIIRPRIQALHTDQTTRLPYIHLSPSEVNSGDTVVRKGEVLVERPAILLPFNLPQFKGFDFEETMGINEDFLKTFFLVRGVQFPSFKYNHTSASMEVYEGKISKAIEHHVSALERDENVHAGLLTGPGDCWQFSVIIFVGSQVVRSAEGDIKRLFEDFGRSSLS